MTGQVGEATKDTGVRRILIVDDEVLIRETGKAMLEMLGYHVETVEGAGQALDLVGDKGKTFDLIMIDLNMPDVPGDECFRALGKIDPAVRAVIISGALTDNPRIQALVSEGLLGTIQKPFSMNALAKTLETLLADT